MCPVDYENLLWNPHKCVYFFGQGNIEYEGRFDIENKVIQNTWQAQSK